MQPDVSAVGTYASFIPTIPVKVAPDLWCIWDGKARLISYEWRAPISLFDGDPRSGGFIVLKTLREGSFSLDGLQFSKGIYLQGNINDFGCLFDAIPKETTP